jgi:hypothetical protein
MTPKLAEFIRSQRFARHLTPGDLARRVGATNVSKMATRLVRFEREGIIDRGLLDALVAVLRIDPVVVQNLMAEDEAESLRAWENWADTAIRPFLAVRILPGVYAHVTVPDDALSPGDAEALAMKYAREKQRSVCLILSRRVSIWVRSDGTVVERVEAKREMIVPSMSLRGEKKKFVLDFHRAGLIRQV